MAIALEVVAYLMLIGKINFTFMSTLTQIIIALVLDLVCVIIGSQLWKKANHIKPASEKNKFLFWLWNNMGLIVCTIATVVAVIALLIGGVASYDFNPVSEKQQQAAIEAISEDVYWSPFGKVYHTHEDCQSLNQSDTLTCGTVEEAIAANRTRLCAFCARKDNIEGVVTDEQE